MAERTYVFSITADAAGFTAATDQAGRSADSLAAKTNALGAQQNASSDAFIRALQAEAAGAGKTRAELLTQKAAQLGVGSAAAEYIKQIEAASHATHGFSFETAASKRELLVLAHELSQGNYKKFGGSLLVLGEQTGAAGFLFSKAGVAALGLTGIIAGLAFEAAKGAIDQDHYNKTLFLTGNYAGQTNDSIATLSRTVATSTNQTVGNARSLLEALTAQSDVGPALFGPLAEAMLRVQKVSGQTTDEVVKQFSKLADEPTKGALELDKAFHFLDSASYEHIHQLEEVGDKQGAARVAADALTGALKDRQAPAINLVGRALDFASQSFSHFLENVRALGAEETFETKLDNLYAKLRRLQDAQRNGTTQQFDALGNQTGGDSGNELAETQAAIAATIKANSEKRDKAAQDAADAETKRRAVAGQQDIDTLNARIRGTDRLTEALAKNAAAERAVFADQQRLDPNATFDIAGHNRREAQIREDNKPRVARTKEDPGAGLLTSITAQQEQLKLEQQQLDSGGKLDEVQKFLAVSGERLAAINGRISATERQRIADGLGLIERTNEQVKASRLLAAVDEDSNKQAEQAQRLTLQAANAVDKFVDQQRVGIELIGKQSDLIGKSALDRERIAANDKLDQQYQNEDRQLTLLQQKAIEEGNTAALEGVTAQRTALHDQTEQLRGELIPAIEDRFRKETAGYAGVDNALAKYRDTAANSAQFAEGVVGGGLNRLESDVADFAETGKSHFSDVFKFMADEFIRQFLRMQIAQSTASASGGGGLLGAIVKGIGTYFGGGSVTDAGSAASAKYGEDTFAYYGTGQAPGHALGGDFGPNQSFVVGEQGPEIVHTGGQSGRIASNSDLRAAASKGAGASDAPATNVYVINSASGTKTTQETKKRADGGTDVRVMVEEAVVSSIKSGGRVHDALSSRYGLNAGGALPRR